MMSVPLLPCEFTAFPDGEVARSTLTRRAVDDLDHAIDTLLDGIGGFLHAKVLSSSVTEVGLDEAVSLL